MVGFLLVPNKQKQKKDEPLQLPHVATNTAPLSMTSAKVTGSSLSSLPLASPGSVSTDKLVVVTLPQTWHLWQAT